MDGFPKIVEAFGTSDGQVFGTKAEAIAHQRSLEFSAWYAENSIPNIDERYMAIWLNDNREALLHLLGAAMDELKSC